MCSSLSHGNPQPIGYIPISPTSGRLTPLDPPMWKNVGNRLNLFLPRAVLGIGISNQRAHDIPLPTSTRHIAALAAGSSLWSRNARLPESTAVTGVASNTSVLPVGHLLVAITYTSSVSSHRAVSTLQPRHGCHGASHSPRHVPSLLDMVRADRIKPTITQ